jgi:hypothetical protein
MHDRWNYGVANAAAGFLGVIIGMVATLVAMEKDALSIQEMRNWIGAAAPIIAIAGAWIAWTNVRTTIRVNLMNREEDRLERISSRHARCRGFFE